MKRLNSILFSLLLVWGQVATAAQSPLASAKKSAPCCECGRMKCCMAESAPVSQPAPVAPIPSSSQNELSLLPSATPSWILPREAAPKNVSSLASSLTPQTQPLYTRDCALLI